MIGLINLLSVLSKMVLMGGFQLHKIPGISDLFLLAQLSDAFSRDEDIA